jgi:8-oxo-dGTP diphosphatase
MNYKGTIMNFLKELQDVAVKYDNVEAFVVGAIIANTAGKIFLARRKEDDFMGGLYEIPGGTSVNGESLYQTLIKGVKEETGLDVVGIESYVGYFDYLSNDCHKYRQFNFKVTVSSCEKISLTEHDGYKWCNFDELETETEIVPKVKHVVLTYVYNELQKNID